MDWKLCLKSSKGKYYGQLCPLPPPPFLSCEEIWVLPCFFSSFHSSFLNREYKVKKKQDHILKVNCPIFFIVMSISTQCSV